MKRQVVRYYRDGWYHAVLVKEGRKWAIIRDLFESTRVRDGQRIRKQWTHKIPTKDIEEGLWGNR